MDACGDESIQFVDASVSSHPKLARTIVDRRERRDSISASGKGAPKTSEVDNRVRGV